VCLGGTSKARASRVAQSLSLLHPGECDHTCDLSLVIPHTSPSALISLHHVGIDKAARCSLVTLKNAIVVGAHNMATFH
jgi:hypothetical protein